MLHRIDGHLPTILSMHCGTLDRPSDRDRHENIFVYQRLAFVDPRRTITQPSPRARLIIFYEVENVGINGSELSGLRRFLAGN
jgi:hypothetical protein